MAYEFGGGAFLVPYLIALFLLGIPLLMMEFALGQKLQQGAVGAFKSINQRFGGIGVTAIYTSFAVVVYYAAVMAWSLIFLLKSFHKVVPWTEDAQGFFFTNLVIRGIVPFHRWIIRRNGIGRL